MTQPPPKYGGKEPPASPLTTGPVEAEYAIQTDREAALAQLKDYHELAKRLMAAADRGQLEETLRVLAVHIGHYQRRHGIVPMDETLAALHADNPTPDQLIDASEGMQCLIGILALVSGLADDAAGSA